MVDNSLMKLSKNCNIENMADFKSMLYCFYCHVWVYCKLQFSILKFVFFSVCRHEKYFGVINIVKLKFRLSWETLNLDSIIMTVW